MSGRARRQLVTLAWLAADPIADARLLCDEVGNTEGPRQAAFSITAVCGLVGPSRTLLRASARAPHRDDEWWRDPRSDLPGEYCIRAGPARATAIACDEQIMAGDLQAAYNAELSLGLSASGSACTQGSVGSGRVLRSRQSVIAVCRSDAVSACRSAERIRKVSYWPGMIGNVSLEQRRGANCCGRRLCVEYVYHRESWGDHQAV
jgi:hypothetical protein